MNAKLFVMRHGESEEDVDKTAYERIADEDMKLTENGKTQATKAGQDLLGWISGSTSVRLILSPSLRILETAQCVVGVMKEGGIRWKLATESLIVKQNWGDVTIHNRSEIEKQRYQTGVLRYQFPGGESGPDVLRRFGRFANKLRFEMSSEPTEPVVIVSHGFEFRLILHSLLGWTENYFETLAHPRHCEIKRLDFDGQMFVLLDEMRQHDLTNNPNFIRREKT